MHFTTLYLMKNEELDNISLGEIERDFSDRFCYCCGETRPRYRYWCDWFQIGGRWAEPIVAKRGLIGERSWCNEKEKRISKNNFAVAEIKDITKPIESDIVYAIATKTRVYSEDEYPEEYSKLLDKINKKLIKGVIAFIDCHD